MPPISLEEKTMPRLGGLIIATILVGLVAAGCGAPSVPRDRITFAVVCGSYYSATPDAAVEGAMVEDSETLLAKAVADLNKAKDLDFVILAGDLLARAEGLSLDRAKSILEGLRMPYYAILGGSDGPAGPAKEPAARPATGAAAASAAAPLGLSRDAIVWAFQGHGFSGPEGYWSQEVLPGLLLVGLDTVRPGRREGHVSARQLEWLDRTLAARGDKSVIIVAYHELMPLHPLDEGAAWQHKLVDNAAAVRQVLEKHPNVLAVLAGNCHFAEGRVSGRIMYLSSPSLAVWPLAYLLVQLTPKQAEAVWVPVAPDDLARRAQDRLLRSPEYRGVFPLGEDGDTTCVRLFGGKKMEVYSLPAIRP
jgi:3',5'-cyclic AMP phosphodiesterase CpdA